MAEGAGINAEPQRTQRRAKGFRVRSRIYRLSTWPATRLCGEPCALSQLSHRLNCFLHFSEQK
jgi:hypothetical protein